MLGFSVIDAPSSDDSDTIGKIADALSGHTPERARFIAVLASLLSRVAYADLSVSAEERAQIQALLLAHGNLSEVDAALVTTIAVNQTRLFGGTQGYLMARDFKSMSSREDRIEMMDCLFAVAAADGEISAAEETELGKIGTELGLDRDEWAHVRTAYRDQRARLKP